MRVNEIHENDGFILIDPIKRLRYFFRKRSYKVLGQLDGELVVVFLPYWKSLDEKKASSIRRYLERYGSIDDSR